MRLADQSVLITGGNSGIGRAIARKLAGEGARIVIAARRAKENETIARELEKEYGVQVHVVTADVSREEDCERAVREAVETFGSLRALVNNAGIGGRGSLAEMSTETFDRILKTNLYGTFWCSRAALRSMRGNPVEDGCRGAILNISSVAGKDAWEGTAAYSASKFGIQALTLALADEGKRHRVKAAAICPALVATPMSGVRGEAYLQPEDCAETAAYLLKLSPAAWPTEIVLPRRDAE